MQAPPRLPARSRPGSRPKKIDVRELEDKFKELQQLRKKDESEQRERERQTRRDAVSQQQTLMRQQRVAERDVLKREVEVDRLEKGLSKVQKETRTKSAKQSEAVAKIDDTLKRLESRQQELEFQLEDKVKESAVAKGRLAHIEYAHTMLNQGQVCIEFGFDQQQLEDAPETSGRENDAKKGAIVPIPSNIPLAERELYLQRQAEELRLENRRRAEENARLRRELEEVRRLGAASQPKPAFACLGGELAAGTFYNLWDEGLDATLGPAFALFATIRFDKFRRSSRIFDFGGGESADNIFVGNRDETNSLVFGVYEGGDGRVLTIKDFWIAGEAHDYLFVITTSGRMQVFRDGEFVGGKQGYPLRSVERRNLYVGRSNWPQDSPFEGSVANIKVWNCEVDWSCAERPPTASPAESWALGPQPPALATSCTYPSGLTLQFPELAPGLVNLVGANAAHRRRLLEDMDSGHHMRVVAWVYQANGWDLEGGLQWRTGDVCEFVTAVFEEMGLVPPSESQLYPLFAKFSPGWSNELSALECLCLADAALRTVFHSEVSASMGRSWSEAQISPSAQPEASGQPTSSTSMRRYVSTESALPLQRLVPNSRNVVSLPDLSLVGGGTAPLSPSVAPLSPSVGHVSTAAPPGSSMYTSSGYGSAGQISGQISPFTATSARSPSPQSSMQATSRPPQAPGYSPGERVEALFSNGHWYPATVQASNSDGTFTISWDDGATYERQKQPHELRYSVPQAAEYTPGQRVEALFSNGAWYPATVQGSNTDGSLTIAWDDGAMCERQKKPQELRQVASQTIATSSKAMITQPPGAMSNAALYAAMNVASSMFAVNA